MEPLSEISNNRAPLLTIILLKKRLAKSRVDIVELVGIYLDSLE